MEKKKDYKMFEIKMSDVRKSQGIAYHDPYALALQLKKADPNIKLKLSDEYYLFTVENDRFKIIKKKGSPLGSSLVTYKLEDNVIIPLYKDGTVRGTLIWLDKTTTKTTYGITRVFHKSGVVLLQGDKFFAYNVTTIDQNIDKDFNVDVPVIKRNIYGWGDIYQ